MTLDVVPAKAEVVAVVRIYTYPQQFAFDTWTGEAGKCQLSRHPLERQFHLPRNFRRVFARLYRPLNYRDFIMFHSLS